MIQRTIRYLVPALLVAAWILPSVPAPVRAAHLGHESVAAGPARPNLLPAVRTWTGNGADDKWSTAANWDSGIPVAGDTLVFPALANRKTNSNDLNTFYGVIVFAVEAVHFGGSGYTLNTLGGGPISLAAGYVMTATGTNTVTIASAFPAGTHLNRVAANGTLILAGTLSGSGDFSKTGPGEIVFAGAQDNVLLGDITVFQGTLTLDKTGGSDAIKSPLTIGGTVGPADDAQVVLNRSNQIPDNQPITIFRTGRFDLDGRFETIGKLTMAGGTVDTFGIGFFIGTVTPTLGIQIDPASATATIQGVLSVPGGGLTIDAKGDPPGGIPALNLAALVRDGGSSGPITKLGPGTVRFSGNNTFTGLIEAKQGTLLADHVNALGQGGAPINVGITGTLHLSAPISTTRPMTLAHSSATPPAIVVDDQPTLNAHLNLSGTNTISITAGAAFTIAQGVSHIGKPTVLVKEGPGTLVYSGEGYGYISSLQFYTYTVAAGTFLFNGASGKLMGFNDLVIAAGATVDLDGAYLNVRGLYGAGSILMRGDTPGIRPEPGPNEVATYAGTITGTGVIQSFADGVQVLSGNSVVSGTTDWFSGTLAIANPAGVGLDIKKLSMFSKQASLEVTNAAGTGLKTNQVVINSCGSLTVTNASGIGIDSKSVSVNPCSRLVGTGVVSSTVSLFGKLEPGANGVGTLTVGTLAFAKVATMTFDLGAPDTANDLVQVNGSLILTGNLAINQLAGFGPGTYRLFNYAGPGFAYYGVNIITPSDEHDYYIDAGTLGQVNLIVQTKGAPPPNVPPPVNIPPVINPIPPSGDYQVYLPVVGRDNSATQLP